MSLPTSTLSGRQHLAVEGEPLSEAGPDENAASRMTLTSSAKVLIVEDDFLIAMQSEEALASAGFEVIGAATTAEEAVSMAINELPALIVMDIRLAGKRDGIDAAREIFERLGTRCIFATAHDDTATRERAAPYNPYGWLSKPYTMASLIALVSGFVHKRS